MEKRGIVLSLSGRGFGVLAFSTKQPTVFLKN